MNHREPDEPRRVMVPMDEVLKISHENLKLVHETAIARDAARSVLPICDEQPWREALLDIITTRLLQRKDDITDIGARLVALDVLVLVKNSVNNAHPPLKPWGEKTSVPGKKE